MNYSNFQFKLEFSLSLVTFIFSEGRSYFMCYTQGSVYFNILQWWMCKLLILNFCCLFAQPANTIESLWNRFRIFKELIILCVYIYIYNILFCCAASTSFDSALHKFYFIYSTTFCFYKFCKRILSQIYQHCAHMLKTSLTRFSLLSTRADTDV